MVVLCCMLEDKSASSKNIKSNIRSERKETIYFIHFSFDTDTLFTAISGPTGQFPELPDKADRIFGSQKDMPEV